MINSRDFPYLNAENHRVTSPESPDYNCVAWAAADTQHWWQPGVFWPVQTQPDDFGLNVLEQAFAALGYVACEDENIEPGFGKIALYEASSYYTHVARQLPNGHWTSKLGRSEDVEHESPNDIAGGVYGAVVRFMKKEIAPPLGTH
jgi:hypothetical protein